MHAVFVDMWAGFYIICIACAMSFAKIVISNVSSVLISQRELLYSKHIGVIHNVF